MNYVRREIGVFVMANENLAREIDTYVREHHSELVSGSIAKLNILIDIVLNDGKFVLSEDKDKYEKGQDLKYNEVYRIDIDELAEHVNEYLVDWYVPVVNGYLVDIWLIKIHRD